MNNVFKKISAIAVAFTLLGTGITISKKIDPKADNTLVAYAACQYHDGSKLNGTIIENYDKNRAEATGERYCLCCGRHTGSLYVKPTPVHNHPTPPPKRK